MQGRRPWCCSFGGLTVSPPSPAPLFHEGHHPQRWVQSRMRAPPPAAPGPRGCSGGQQRIIIRASGSHRSCRCPVTRAMAATRKRRSQLTQDAASRRSCTGHSRNRAPATAGTIGTDPMNKQQKSCLSSSSLPHHRMSSRPSPSRSLR